MMKAFSYNEHMRTITTEDFKNNIDLFLSKEIEEEIKVTEGYKVVFYLTPKSIKLMRDIESLFGSLPREAYEDDDISRE